MKHGRHLLLIEIHMSNLRGKEDEVTHSNNKTISVQVDFGCLLIALWRAMLYIQPIRRKGSYLTQCDVNMRFQRWQLFDFPAWKFPSRPESVLDNEKWGNFLVDFSLKTFGEKQSVNWTTEWGRVSGLHHTLLARLLCVETWQLITM